MTGQEACPTTANQRLAKHVNRPPGLSGAFCRGLLGQRVLAGAITPRSQCEECLGGHRSQCGGPLGGWKLGNTRVPHAQANLALIPDDLSDEQVLLLADVASTGFSVAENGGVKLGDNIAVFAHGARLMGAAQIIATDSDGDRLRMTRRLGATPTGGHGVDVTIEALGTQETFGNALRVLRPGGTMAIPLDGFMRRLMRLMRLMRLVRLVHTQRIDLTPLLTHVVPLDEIETAYHLSGSRKAGVLKIAIRVS